MRSVGVVQLDDPVDRGPRRSRRHERVVIIQQFPAQRQVRWKRSIFPVVVAIPGPPERDDAHEHRPQHGADHGQVFGISRYETVKHHPRQDTPAELSAGARL
jgi:hypothetical protein